MQDNTFTAAHTPFPELPRDPVFLLNCKAQLADLLKQATDPEHVCYAAYLYYLIDQAFILQTIDAEGAESI